MKIYQAIDGVTHAAEAPDDALHLELGATMPVGGGEPLAPIVLIENDARRYQRRGGDPEPFPERTFRTADLDWRPAAD